MPATKRRRTIPSPLLAEEKLSPETLEGLKDYYSSDALTVTTGRGDFDPAKQRSKWLRTVIKEPSAVAERCIDLLLWHHQHETTRLENWRDFEFLVGILYYEPDGKRITREQETGLLKVAKTLSGYMEAKFGLTHMTKTYGTSLSGATVSDNELGEYVLNHPEHAEAVCTIIRKRGVIDTVNIAAIIDSMGTPSLAAGAL